MTAPDLTAEQLQTAIAAAIHAHDFEAVAAFLRVLSVKDPHRAHQILQTINVGLAIGRERDG